MISGGEYFEGSSSSVLSFGGGVNGSTLVITPQLVTAFAANIALQPRKVARGAVRISGGGVVEIFGHQEFDESGENERAFWRLVMAAEIKPREKS